MLSSSEIPQNLISVTLARSIASSDEFRAHQSPVTTRTHFFTFCCRWTRRDRVSPAFDFLNILLLNTVLFVCSIFILLSRESGGTTFWKNSHLLRSFRFPSSPVASLTSSLLLVRSQHQAEIKLLILGSNNATTVGVKPSSRDRDYTITVKTALYSFGHAADILHLGSVNSGLTSYVEKCPL